MFFSVNSLYHVFLLLGRMTSKVINNNKRAIIEKDKKRQFKEKHFSLLYILLF